MKAELFKNKIVEGGEGGCIVACIKWTFWGDRPIQEDGGVLILV